MPLKVLIADDHPLVRQAMRTVFVDQGPECEVTEADGLDAVLKVLDTDDIDLLLMDLGMPGMDGAESLRALRETYSATKIAVVTGQDDRGTILDCLSAGIHGYILKSSPVEEILQAVTLILSGRVYVTPALARFAPPQGGWRTEAGGQQFQSPAPQSRVAAPQLTKRQVEVLRLLKLGQQTKQIARGLDLGIGTVKIHISAVFRALNAKNRTEAALMASRFNL